MKSTLAGNLFVLTVAAALSAPAAADSISTVYDMDRMLFEPHPLANQYGTRWRPALPTVPVTPTPAVSLPVAPSPIVSPFPAPPPEPPPTTFPPPPPITTTAPPAPAEPPVVTEAAAPPLLVMSPRLSIDMGGLDLEPDAAEPAQQDKESERPGPAPPPPR